VIFVTSGGAYTEPLVVDKCHEQQTSVSGLRKYAQDKRRQIALTERFAELWSTAQIGCYCMHPGWVDTVGLRKSIPGFYKTFKGKLRSLNEGADTVIWLALSENAALQSGAMYLDRQPQVKHFFGAGTTYSREEVDRLWGLLLRLSRAEEFSEISDPDARLVGSHQ
jgi:dehydrogenase/reductase SDR family member 12